MILKGKKVILRPIKMSDGQRFVKWLADEEVRKFLSGRPKGPTLKEEKIWIKGLAKRKEQKHFAIETKDHLHLGSCGLRLNLKDKHAILGILIGDKNYWSEGYGTEVMKILLNYGFNKLKLHRIELGVYNYNKRAIRLYKKIGFKLEGIKREHIFWQGKFYDDWQMGLLKREWKIKRDGKNR